MFDLDSRDRTSRLSTAPFQLLRNIGGCRPTTGHDNEHIIHQRPSYPCVSCAKHGISRSTLCRLHLPRSRLGPSDCMLGLLIFLFVLFRSTPIRDSIVIPASTCRPSRPRKFGTWSIPASGSASQDVEADSPRRAAEASRGAATTVRVLQGILRDPTAKRPILLREEPTRYDRGRGGKAARTLQACRPL